MLCRVSHRGVGQALVLTKTAQQDLPRMQPQTHGVRRSRWPRWVHGHAPDTLLEPQRRPHGPPGVILLRHRGTKQDQASLILHRLEGPLIPLDGLQGQGTQRLHRLVLYLCCLSRCPRRQRGEGRELTDEDGDHFLFPCKGSLRVGGRWRRESSDRCGVSNHSIREGGPPLP